MSFLWTVCRKYMKSTRRVLGHSLVRSHRSLAPELKGRRSFSLKWMRRFHTISTHCARHQPAFLTSHFTFLPTHFFHVNKKEKKWRKGEKKKENTSYEFCFFIYPLFFPLLFFFLCWNRKLFSFLSLFFFFSFSCFRQNGLSEREIRIIERRNPKEIVLTSILILNSVKAAARVGRSGRPFPEPSGSRIPRGSQRTYKYRALTVWT